MSKTVTLRPSKDNTPPPPDDTDGHVQPLNAGKCRLTPHLPPATYGRHIFVGVIENTGHGNDLCYNWPALRFSLA